MFVWCFVACAWQINCAQWFAHSASRNNVAWEGTGWWITKRFWRCSCFVSMHSWMNEKNLQSDLRLVLKEQKKRSVWFTLSSECAKKKFHGDSRLVLLVRTQLSRCFALNSDCAKKISGWFTLNSNWAKKKLSGWFTLSSSRAKKNFQGVLRLVLTARKKFQGDLRLILNARKKRSGWFTLSSDCAKKNFKVTHA